MPRTAMAAPMIRPIHDGWVDTSAWAKCESAKVGRRKLVTASSTPGICSTPPTTASSASTPIATFIGHSRSAMW